METITAELLAQLRKVPILSSLKDDELHCLEGVREIHLDKDEFLARQGEVAHFFWILLEGEIRVFQTHADGHEWHALQRSRAGTPSANCRFWQIFRTA